MYLNLGGNEPLVMTQIIRICRVVNYTLNKVKFKP